MVDPAETTATCGRRPSARPAAPTSLRRHHEPLSRWRTGRAQEGGSASYSLLLKDSVIYGAGRVLQKFLGALLPLFTAFLTKADYGIIGMVVTVVTFLDVFVTLGFDVAFSRFFFDNKIRSTAARSSPTPSTWTSSTRRFCSAPSSLFMPQISSAIMGGSGYTIYFDIGVATLFFTNLSDLPFTSSCAWSTGRGRSPPSPSPACSSRCRWPSSSSPSSTGARRLPAAPTSSPAIVLNVAALPFYVPRLRFLWDKDLMRSMLAFAIPAMFTAISFFFLKLSDRFFLLHYQGKAEVGLYTVANSLAQPLYIVGMAFRMAWPQWHYAQASTSLRSTSGWWLALVTYFMAFNGALLALVGVYLPLVIHVLLNEKFWSIGPTTFVLTLSVALYNLYFIFWIGANVAKKNRLIPVITLVASGVNVGLNFLLVPTYGMWAAAWTTTIGFGILAVLVYFVSNSWYPIPYEWRRLITLAVATVLTLGAGWAIGRAAGVRVDEPLTDLILGSLAMTPALLVFPLVLWVGPVLHAR